MAPGTVTPGDLSRDVLEAWFIAEQGMVRDFLTPTEFADASFVLAGSRSTGSSDGHSDHDFYVMVDNHAYTQIYDRARGKGIIESGESLILRVDQPEITAKLVSEHGIRHHLAQEFVHFFFIFSNAVVLADRHERYRRLIAEYRLAFEAQLPELIWLRYKDLLKAKHWLGKYAIRDVDASFDVIKQTAIRSAYELCFLMERRPFPYGKWLDFWAERATAFGARARDRLVMLHRIFDRDEMAEEAAWLFDAMREALTGCGLDLPFVANPFRYMASQDGFERKRVKVCLCVDADADSDSDSGSDGGFPGLDVLDLGVLRGSQDGAALARSLAPQTRISLAIHSEAEIAQVSALLADIPPYRVTVVPARELATPACEPEPVARTITRLIAALDRDLQPADVAVVIRDIATRPLPAVKRLVDTAIAAGATTVILEDSDGTALPHEVSRLVRLALGWLSDENTLAIRCWNTHGLANANAMSAIAAGIDEVHVSLAGAAAKASELASLSDLLALLHTHAGTSRGYMSLEPDIVTVLRQRFAVRSSDRP